MLAGIGLVSFSTLLLELALTRLFSVILFYHFAFLGISLAMLGLGAGGVFAYLRRSQLESSGLRPVASWACVLNSVAIMMALQIVLHVNVSASPGLVNFLRLTAIYLAVGVPFFFTGLLFAVVFGQNGVQVTQLYGADLIGGAIACLAIVPLLDWLGGPNAIVCAALVMAISAAIWARRGRQRNVAIAMAAVLTGLIAANHSEKVIDIVYAKGQLNSQEGQRLEFARWNPISRVEVDNVGASKWIRIDADASTRILSADPRDPSSYSHTELFSRSPAVANVLRPRGDYAIIGPGGGIDVFRAVASGSQNVTGIEINPIIVNTIMRGSYADYAHHLYELPQVHIRVSDGRSWIRDNRGVYDVIQMTLVDTWASTAAGAFALSENNLYTVEAFREYFDHLKPDGLIAITRWEFSRPRESLRVVSQAVEVFRRMGIEDVRNHFIVVADGPVHEGAEVTVLAKKTPFTPEEERAVLGHVQSTPNLYPLYTPHVYGNQDKKNVVCVGATPPSGGRGCIETGLVQLAEQRRASSEALAPFEQLISLPSHSESKGLKLNPREEFIHNYPFDITPVTDNAPFFFFTFKMGSALRALLTHTGRSVGWRNNLGVDILGMLLIISIVAVLAFLVGPLALHREVHKHQLLPLLYFVALGLGYILVEIALIQRFVLFLGHPTYALTVVLFLMLLSSGLGSMVSQRWLTRTSRVQVVLAVIIAVLVIYTLLLHRILESSVSLSFPIKLLLSGALLVPLGLLMGIPFPTGLRVIGSRKETLKVAPHTQFSEAATADGIVEWAWAMNAASSVLGSVLVMVVVISFGLNAALACAALSYLFATGLTTLWKTA
jgi:hypothetical protein